MKFLKISNKGTIDVNALTLIGASSKVNDSTKIGQFGSGNKYALAYLLRNKYNLKVFSGHKEIIFSTEKESFRENDFEVIYVDGIRTSITTQMGKDWKLWQALREIYSNAMDEGDQSIDFVQDITTEEEKTAFYIDTTPEVIDFIQNFDNYFSTAKKVLFENDMGRILEKKPGKANVYRRGIKCYETNKDSLFDYDFNDITIDENRLVMYYWQIEEKIWSMIMSCDDPEIINTVMANIDSHTNIESSISDYSYINASKCSDTFKKCIQKTNLAPKGYAGLLKPDEVHNHNIVPNKVFQAVRGIISDDNVASSFKIEKKGAFYRELEMTRLAEKVIKDAMDFFNECQFEIPYQIELVKFDDPNILGSVKNSTILLSDICIEKGLKETVQAILEEYIHIKHDVRDKTRAFQNASLNEMVTYMTKINSYSI